MNPSQGGFMNQIAGLDSNSWKWSLLGYLNTARSTHNVIIVGNRFMVVGGVEYKGGSQNTKRKISTDLV